MTDQCFGRLQKDKEPHRGRFGDKHRFYLEYRCEGKVSQKQLCAKCLEWKERGLKKTDHYRSHHGLITEPIPEWSHIFEGPWYQSKVASYGHPSNEDMVRAREAQQAARNGVIKEDTAPVVEAEKPKKSGRKKKEVPVDHVPVPVDSVPTDPVPVAVDSVPKPKAPGKRRPKKATNPVVSVQAPIVQVQAVETSSLPNEVEIVKIVVRSFVANGTLYFRDTTKNKLYSVGKDKRPSTYVGRWDPETETIDTEFPDSDAE